MTSNQRHALVTGGGSGIGKAIARKLASEGCAVSVLALSESTSTAVAGEIIRAGQVAFAVACDLSTRDGVIDAVIEAQSLLGPVDILVNNVGIYPSCPFLEITDDEWDRVMAVCLKSLLWSCQACLPEMVRRRRGRVINMASIDGKWPGPGNAAYSAAKAGVISLTRSLAADMAEYGSSVNAIAPGGVETPNILKGNRWKEALRDIPMKRLARPEEIADVASFLASEKAAYITGETFNINGGMLMD